MKYCSQKNRADFSSTKTVVAFVLIGVVILAIPLSASDYEIFSMTDFSSGELRMEAFRLVSESELHIEIVGARFRNSDQMYALGWILDSETRDVVWSMDRENTKRLAGEKNLRYYDDFIELDEGTYEAYYYSGKPMLVTTDYDFDKDMEELGDILNNLGVIVSEVFDMDVQAYAEMRKQYKFKIFSEMNNFQKLNIATPNLPNQVISIVRPRNLADVHQGFLVKEEVDLFVYSFGEFSEKDDLFMDGAKIVNAKTREVVWAMERWNTDWSGGSSKNRCYYDEIYLEPGRYILHYWTDDSHTFDDWVGVPPYDPYFWGVTLAVADEDEINYIEPYDIDANRHVLAQIVRIGNNQHAIRDFRINNELEIAIYAIGEGRRGYMYDYGWIENIDDNEVVWMMEEEETVHAGGASKNRAFDGTIVLDEGDYSLHFKTDGSHSYRSWNEPAPSDVRNYGIYLYNYAEDFDPGDFELGKLRTLNELGYNVHEGDLTLELQDLNDSLVEMSLRLDEDHLKAQQKHAEAMEEFNRQFKEMVKDQAKKAPKPPASPNILVKMDHLGDDVSMQSFFSLDSAWRIRIYAIGEGMNGSMYDYGWIENSATGQTVWKMLFSKTHHAGGSSKNRMIDDVIMLEEGHYEVFFITDDSHSFPDWNATAPDDPEGWGITIELVK